MNRQGDEATGLLTAQLADLGRYRSLLEAQRAVLRNQDAALLLQTTADAAGVAADISARDSQLLSVRAAAQIAAANEPHATRLAELYAQVERERARAGSEARVLADEIERETPQLARAIQASGRNLAAVFRGYGSSGQVGAPSMIDRRG